MKKKIATPIIAILLALLVLSGCAQQNMSPTASPSVEPTQPQETSTPIPQPTFTPETVVAEALPDTIARDTQVVFWHPFYGETANVMAELAEQFNQENEWGIQVNSQPHGDKRVIVQDMEAAREIGELPTAAALPMEYLRALQQVGAYLQDMDILLQSEQWGLADEEVASFFPIFWGATVLNGYRVGLPAYWSGYYLFYNQSWAAELGFSERPVTIAELQAQACAAARHNLYDDNPDTSGTGGYAYRTEPYAAFSWMRAFGGAQPSRAGRRWQLNSPADVAAWEFLFDLYQKGCSWTGRQAVPYRYFGSRLALFYSGRLEEVLVQSQVNQIEGSGDQWMLMPYPSAEGKPVVFIEGYAHAILTADEQETLAAWEWIKWLLQPQNQARLVAASGSYPLSLAGLEELEAFRLEHPAWSQALLYLALAEPVPTEPGWQTTKDVLSDFAWQLIRFTTRREDIPLLLESAETMLDE